MFLLCHKCVSFFIRGYFDRRSNGEIWAWCFGCNFTYPCDCTCRFFNSRFRCNIILFYCMHDSVWFQFFASSSTYAYADKTFLCYMVKLGEFLLRLGVTLETFHSTCMHRQCFSASIRLEKLPSIEVGPTALAWPMTLTLTFNLLKAMAMAYSQAKVQSQRSVGSEERVETNGQTDRRTDIRTEAIASPLALMLSVKIDNDTDFSSSVFL